MLQDAKLLNMHQKGKKQLQLFKGANLNRLEWSRPQTLWYMETFRCLTSIRDSSKSPGILRCRALGMESSFWSAVYIVYSVYLPLCPAPVCILSPLPHPNFHTPTYGQNVIGRATFTQETLYELVLFYEIRVTASKINMSRDMTKPTR